MNKLSRKNWITFCIIVSFEVFILIIRFNFMNLPIAFFKSVFHLFGISTVYLFTDSFIHGFLLALIILNIIISLFLIRYFLQEPLETYGFHFRKIHLQLLSGALLTFIIVWFQDELSITKILSLFNHFIEYFSAQTLLNLLKTLILAVQEEILFRGFLFTFFQKLFKKPMYGMFLSAIMFGMVHYPIGYSIGHGMDYVIHASLLGLIYGYLRLKSPETFTLYSLSLAHCLYNII